MSLHGSLSDGSEVFHDARESQRSLTPILLDRSSFSASLATPDGARDGRRMQLDSNGQGLFARHCCNDSDDTDNDQADDDDGDEEDNGNIKDDENDDRDEVNGNSLHIPFGRLSVGNEDENQSIKLPVALFGQRRAALYQVDRSSDNDSDHTAFRTPSIMSSPDGRRRQLSFSKTMASQPTFTTNVTAGVRDNSPPSPQALSETSEVTHSFVPVELPSTINPPLLDSYILSPAIGSPKCLNTDIPYPSLLSPTSAFSEYSSGVFMPHATSDDLEEMNNAFSNLMSTLPTNNNTATTTTTDTSTKTLSAAYRGRNFAEIVSTELRDVEKRKHTVYKVRVQNELNHNWLVWKRYSDFFALYHKLSKHYPSTKPPTFPPKKIFGSSLNDQLIQYRIKKINRYLQFIFDNNELATSLYSCSFFGFPPPPSTTIVNGITGSDSNVQLSISTSLSNVDGGETIISTVPIRNGLMSGLSSPSLLQTTQAPTNGHSQSSAVRIISPRFTSSATPPDDTRIMISRSYDKVTHNSPLMRARSFSDTSTKDFINKNKKKRRALSSVAHRTSKIIRKAAQAYTNVETGIQHVMANGEMTTRFRKSKMSDISVQPETNEAVLQSTPSMTVNGTLGKSQPLDPSQPTSTTTSAKQTPYNSPSATAIYASFSTNNSDSTQTMPLPTGLASLTGTSLNDFVTSSLPDKHIKELHRGVTAVDGTPFESFNSGSVTAVNPLPSPASGRKIYFPLKRRSLTTTLVDNDHDFTQSLNVVEAIRRHEAKRKEKRETKKAEKAIRKAQELNRAASMGTDPTLAIGGFSSSVSGNSGGSGDGSVGNSPRKKKKKKASFPLTSTFDKGNVNDKTKQKDKYEGKSKVKDKTKDPGRIKASKTKRRMPFSLGRLRLVHDQGAQEELNFTEFENDSPPSLPDYGPMPAGPALMLPPSVATALDTSSSITSTQVQMPSVGRSTSSTLVPTSSIDHLHAVTDMASMPTNVSTDDTTTTIATPQPLTPDIHATIRSDRQIDTTSIQSSSLRRLERHMSDSLTIAGVEEVSKSTAKICLDDFQLLKMIGKGTFGKVMLARNKTTKAPCAIKVISKCALKKHPNEIKQIMSERHVLQTNAKHPFLISLQYAFQTPDKLYFVLDYVNGGELFFHLQRERRFSEDRVRFYAAEITSALAFLHGKDIIYRDLKPENILLDREGHIALTDFGLAKEGIVESGGKTSTFCGTPEYLAPEILRKQPYGLAVDWWCVGCVVYEMLVGLPPFYSANAQELFNRILNDKLRFPPQVSLSSRKFIAGLLVRNPARRLGANGAYEVTSHPFFEGVDWDKITAKSYIPPFRPNLMSTMDLRYIDPSFHEENIQEADGNRLNLMRDTLLDGDDDDDNAFAGFTYMGELDDIKREVHGLSFDRNVNLRNSLGRHTTHRFATSTPVNGKRISNVSVSGDA